MKHVLPLLLVALGSARPGVAQPTGAAPGLDRLFANFESAPWPAGEYSMASGSAELVADVPEAVRDTSKQSMQVNIDYSGKGFEAFSVVPPKGSVPGRLRKLSLWVKPQTEGYAWFLKLKGPDGEDKLDGKNLEVSLRGEPGEWKLVEFVVPPNWPQPLSIASIGGHNWGKQSVKATARLLVDELRVTADLSDVHPKETNLLDAQLACPRSRNVFVEGEPVEFALSFDSWLGKPVTGDAEWTVRDLAGGEWARETRQFQFTDLHGESILLVPKRFGVHELSLTCRLSTGDELRKHSRFAYVPKPHELTDAEKLASPWGINIHGGNPGVAYDALARCGFTWVRDYAYSFEWLNRARGDDGKYGGWPWYPKMEGKLRDSGLMLLPCLVGAIDRNAAREGKRVPDAQWKRDLMHILISFPQHTAWELDNEYEYKHGEEEVAAGWATYQGYHRVFGEAVNFLDENMLAVEQGTAGVFPERVESFVKSGAFDNIDVVNCHHYCGTEPPEVNVFNRNVGSENAPPRLFFDVLRELCTAADCDGKDRQTWITEFGWDTLAGHIVPEAVQAAYLQRGYLMCLQAGLDKLFWYWNRDAKDEPDNFFDGCGIWNAADEPKPAAAAAAALFRFLELPDPLGTCEFGPNTLGYVFRDQGRLVACAFVVEDKGEQPTVEFSSGECFDLYGNSLRGRKHALSIAPTWIVDLAEDDPLVRQTAYALKSRHFVRLTAGDMFTLECEARNRGDATLQAAARLEVPEGWSTARSQVVLQVAGGQAVTAPFEITIPDTEKQGQKTVTLTVTEGDVTKTLTTTVRVEQPVNVSPLTLTGTPGTADATVRVRNRSNRPKTVRLKATVPQSWRAVPAEQQVTLAPNAETEAKLQIEWNTDWHPHDTAAIDVSNEGGEVLAQAGIIPSSLRLARVEDIEYDGKLDDWPAAARLPAWALGCATGPANADLYAGYSDAGLHFAFVVRDSRVHVADPKLFWLQDAIEVFVDTKGDKTARQTFAATDHQFWLCPLVEEKHAYVGRWKRSDEIPATVYDVPAVKSFAGKQGDGYVLEVLLPTSALSGFSPRTGAQIGLNLNLTVHGHEQNREPFWPRPKDGSVLNMPNSWGTATFE